MDVTRWELVEGGGPAHRSQPCGSQWSEDNRKERMDELSGSRLEEGSLWAIYQPL